MNLHLDMTTEDQDATIYAILDQLSQPYKSAFATLMSDIDSRRAKDGVELDHLLRVNAILREELTNSRRDLEDIKNILAT